MNDRKDIDKQLKDANAQLKTAKVLFFFVFWKQNKVFFSFFFKELTYRGCSWSREIAMMGTVNGICQTDPRTPIDMSMSLA